MFTIVHRDRQNRYFEIQQENPSIKFITKTKSTHDFFPTSPTTAMQSPGSSGVGNSNVIPIVGVQYNNSFQVSGDGEAFLQASVITQPHQLTGNLSQRSFSHTHPHARMHAFKRKQAHTHP